MAGSVGHEATAGATNVRSEGPSTQLERILADDETLLWCGTPYRRAWYFSSLVAGPLAILALVLGVGGAFATFAWLSGDVTLVGAAKILAAVWFGLSVLASGATLAQLRHLEYAVTDRRVIKFGGIVGRDATTVAVGDIQDVEAGAGLLTKLFGAGGVTLKAPGGPSSGLALMSIENHRDVQKLILDARETTGD